LFPAAAPLVPAGRQIAFDAGGSLYRFDMDTRQFRQLTRGPLPAFSPAWSPDGRRLVYFQITRISPTLRVAMMTMDAHTGRRQAVVPHLRGAWEEEQPRDALGSARMGLSASWSPTGKTIVYANVAGRNGAIWLVDAAGGEPKRLAPETENVSFPNWSPDGRRLVYLAAPPVAEEGAEEEGAPPEGRETLRVADAATRSSRLLFALPPGFEIAAPPRWTNDGRTVGVSLKGPGDNESGMQQAWLIPVGWGKVRKLVDIPGETWFTFSRSGRTVLYWTHPDDSAGETEGVVACMSAPTWRRRVLFTMPKLRDPDPSPVPVLSPDGSCVAVVLAPEDGPARLRIAPVASGRPRDYLVPTGDGA